MAVVPGAALMKVALVAAGFVENKLPLDVVTSAVETIVDGPEIERDVIDAIVAALLYAP